MKKVSIIVPCYNCQTRVSDTLDSLAAQSYPDFEVVCVNDGSTDDTISVLEQYKEKGTLDMQIISKPNGGVSSARNVGIQAAKGKYLLFLDADDLYHPTYIQHLCNAMEYSDVDIAYCLLSRDAAILTEIRQTIPVVIQTQEEAMHNLLYRMPEVGFYCYLYRKDWIIREKLEFDENTQHFEDREFNWKYLCHCKSAAFVDAPLYYYRVVETSVTNRKTVRWRTDGLEATLRIEEYMEQVGCDFLPKLKDYLLPRVMWSMAKNYALGGANDAFDRLGREYDVKACMKRTAKDSNKLVALASWLYLIHPKLFFTALNVKKR